jgi:hypothetical protein
LVGERGARKSPAFMHPGQLQRWPEGLTVSDFFRFVIDACTVRDGCWMLAYR